MKTPPLKIIVVAILCSAGTGFAAPIFSYVGTVGLDEAQAWRDSSVAKTYSVNGTNTYGNAGYLAFGTKTDTTGGSNVNVSLNNSYLPDLPGAANIQWSMPAWISATNAAGGSYVVGTDGAGTKSVFNFGGAFDSANFSYNPSAYPVINNPLNASANERVGVVTTDSNTLTDMSLNFVVFNFTTAGTYRFGILVNTLEDSSNAMDFVGVSDLASSAAISLSLNRTSASLVFFDATVQAGDVAAIYGSIGSTAGRGVLSYVTLDVVPEPNTGHYLLLGLAGFAGFVVRKKLSGKRRFVADLQG